MSEISSILFAILRSSEYINPKGKKITNADKRYAKANANPPRVIQIEFPKTIKTTSFPEILSSKLNLTSIHAIISADRNKTKKTAKIMEILSIKLLCKENQKSKKQSTTKRVKMKKNSPEQKLREFHNLVKSNEISIISFL
jgi:hypothetical protein